MAEIEGSMIDISTDITKLKVPELKKELKLRGLSSGGNKNELVERLQRAISNGGSVSHDSVDELLEEDILEDDDDEQLEANEALILDNDLEESPKGQKRKEESISDKDDIKKPATKKVVLNRNYIATETVKQSVASKSETVEEKVDQNSEDRKIIKLSQINAKERLELRAKKFGITSLSADAMKVVRAERFGSANGSSAHSITSSKSDTSADILKKRAERFGSSVSTIALSLENKEKMEKRKARFNVTDNSNSDKEEKAKARLERFKEPVM